MATVTVQVIECGTPWLDIVNVRLLDSNGFEIPITLDDDSSFSTVIIRGSDSSQAAKMSNSWDFDKADTWGDFAAVDDDSTELIIGVDKWPDAELMDLIAKNDGKLIDEISIGNKIEAIVTDMPFETISSFVTKVQATGLSKYVEPNLLIQADFIPNDPDWDDQWGPQRIEADWAWNTTTGSAINVSVLDSGIRYDHNDLDGNYVLGGFDFVNNDMDPMDDWSHGTTVAGVIAAEINNNYGIAGLAQIGIMAEKCMNGTGWGSILDIARAINHTVDSCSVDIINLSLGTYTNSDMLHAAIEYAYDNGMLIVASAGNDNTSSNRYPAAYNEVIAVTATNESDLRWEGEPNEGSNYGSWVEVAAPGVHIWTTWGWKLNGASGIGFWNVTGTSYAAPHVAGVAALIWSQFPDMTRNQVRLQLRYSTDDLGDDYFDEYYGYGIVNASRSVTKIVADANDDGKVDDDDMNILEDAWGTEEGDPDYDPRADFNHDDEVNYKDLYILAVFWEYGT